MATATASKKTAAKKAATAKKPATKKAATAKKPATKAAPKTTATKAATTTAAANVVNGVEIASGSAKAIKAGGSKNEPLVTLLTLDQLAVEKGFNPRASLGDLDALKNGIKTEGFTSALTVRPAKNGKFSIVCGERRFTALTELEWNKGIPCVVRTDLADDDDLAKAVAVAENSEDARYKLNPIDEGRVLKDLADKAWSVTKIAKATSMHAHTVRRRLALMNAPEDVQKTVEEGTLSVTAGLELAKLDDSQRKAVAAELHAGLSASDVKKLRKEADKAAAESSGGEGADGGQKVTKAGKVSKRQPTAWQGSKEKQSQIERLSYYYVGAQGTEDEGTQDYYEIRGALAYALFDRGDIPDPMLPSGDSEDKGDIKVLKRFETLAKSAAAIFAKKNEDESED